MSQCRLCFIVFEGVNPHANDGPPQIHDTRRRQRSVNDSESQSPTLDRLFRALSHQSRRRILVFLVRTGVADEAVELETFAAEVAETNVDTEQLYHVHLPYLDETGFVEWNHEQQTVQSGPLLEETESMLELLDQNRSEVPAEWP